MHPNAVPSFNLIYNADTDAISVTEILFTPPRHGKEENKTSKKKIMLLFYAPRVNRADETFRLNKKPFSISKCIIKEYMCQHKIIISQAAQR